MLNENKPKSTNVSEDDIKKVAKALGVDLGNTGGKADKESKSDKKTDTETIEKEGRSGESEKSKDDLDYKKMYGDSTREYQSKYKPMEQTVQKLEEMSGKTITELLESYYKKDDVSKEDKSEKTTPKGDDEVKTKLTSLEEKLSAIVEKVDRQEENEKISLKERVKKFCNEYNISEEEYNEKIHPNLKVIKDLRKDNGEPYTLEEALKKSFLIANSDKIDKIVELKLQQKKKEEELSFSPSNSRQASEWEVPKFTDAQVEMARKLRTNLKEDEEKK